MPHPLETPRLMPTSSRLHRLAYYMIGLAIGLMMVGVIVSVRNQFLRQPVPAAAGVAEPVAPNAPVPALEWGTAPR